MSIGAVVGAQMAEDGAEDDIPTQETSHLRVAHASPDAPAVDVYLDNESVLTGVEFGNVSEYMAVQAGEYNVTITAAGDREAVVFEDSLTLEPRSVTTVAAAGEISQNATQPFTPLLYDDNALEPAENESAISVVHLSPDAPAVDVTATGEDDNVTVLADNISFSAASDYTTVPSGDYTVQVRAATADNNGTVVSTVNVTLEEETAHSALAIGFLEAENDTQPFQVSLNKDVTASYEFPSEEPAGPPEEPGEGEGEGPPEEPGEGPPEEENGTATETGTEAGPDNETGTPAEEAGTPAEEAGTPTEEAGTPTEETETATEEAEG
jgi:hypothetical protein